MSSDSAPERDENQPLKLALVRRNPWMLSPVALPLVTALCFLVWGIHSGNLLFPFLVPHLLILAASLFAMIWIRNPRPREIEGLVAIDDQGVSIGHRLALAREQIKAGFVVPRPGKRPFVRLERKTKLAPALEIAVENEEEGRRVLRHLGLDATQTIASFVLPSRLFADKRIQRRYMAVLLACIAVLGMVRGLFFFHAEILPIVIGLMSVGFAVTGLLTRTHLHIGADGIVIRWFRTERFIPYDAIENIESYEEKRFQRRRWAGVHLLLESGETITLPIASAGQVGGPRVRLVTNRLQEAFADHQRGARAAVEARLMRGEQQMHAWVRSLRRAGAGAGANHRIAPVPTDRLLEVVEDPHADPIMRANAAIALGADTEHAEIRSRVRVAAQATAAPRLRVALEKAVENEDEAALAEALAAVEAEADKTTKRK